MGIWNYLFGGSPHQKTTKDFSERITKQNYSDHLKPGDWIVEDGFSGCIWYSIFKDTKWLFTLVKKRNDVLVKWGGSSHNFGASTFGSYKIRLPNPEELKNLKEFEGFRQELLDSEFWTENSLDT